MSALWLEAFSVVRVSESLAAITDDSFVLTAVGIPHHIERSLTPDVAGHFLVQLQVESPNLALAEVELSRYRQENLNWPVRESVGPKFILPTLQLLGLVIVLAGFFWVQNFFMSDAQVLAAASSHRIVTHLEIGRAVTSLFLHADFSHFIGNLFLAVVLAAALIHTIGTGLTFAGFFISGALGNIVNSYFYDEPFRYAYGFSTALFGAAGIWAGYRLIEYSRVKGVAPWRRTIAPIGAALTFLAAWGASPQTDFMAHFWGATIGFLLGIAVAKFRAKDFLGRCSQAALTFGVLLAVALAWKSVL